MNCKIILILIVLMQDINIVQVNIIVEIKYILQKIFHTFEASNSLFLIKLSTTSTHMAIN